MASTRSEHFAAIPMRAFGDERLKLRHFHVLGVVAIHDRFGANGTGCYANHRRLAQMARCDYTTLSKAMADPGSWGFLEAKPHPLNKRLRVYRVLYTDADIAYFKGADVGPQTNDGNSTVGLVNSQPTDSTSESPVNIFCEAEKISHRNGEDSSLESASLCSDACHQGDGIQDIHRRASILERRWRQSPGDPAHHTAAETLLEDAEATDDMEAIRHVERIRDEMQVAQED